MPAGFPKVDINFRLNADGILTVEAVELRSGVKQEVEVKPTYGLTDREVEKMLIESIQNAKEDVSKRMLIESRTEGEQMVYTVERFLEKNKEYISEQELTDTQNLIETLKKVLTSGDKDLIHNAIDELNEFTRPFAERLMNVAIGSAMKGKAIE